MIMPISSIIQANGISVSETKSNGLISETNYLWESVIILILPVIIALDLSQIKYIMLEI